MKIPIVTYAEVSRRMETIGIGVFLAGAAFGMLICVLGCLPIATAVRDFVGGNLGLTLAIAISIPFLLLPLFLPMIAIRIIDRRCGIRCPNCNVSLTMRSLPEKILITRRCSQCQTVVLTDDPYTLAPEAFRPRVIVPLLMLLTLLIAWWVASEVSSPSSHLKTRTFWSEGATHVFAILAIAKMYSMIMKVMKRRWQIEAAADESERIP